jgi:hypothetical protein
LRLVESAVWTVDIANIPSIELDVFTGTTALRTHYCVVQLMRRSRYDIRPATFEMVTADLQRAMQAACLHKPQKVAVLRLRRAAATFRNACP